MKKIVAILLLCFAFFQSNTLSAQDIFKGSDLSTIKIDYLSDSDIAKIKSQLQANKATLDQVEPLAMAKGMSATEFNKLRARLGVSKANLVSRPQNLKSGDSLVDNEEFLRKQEKIENKKVKDSLNSLIFGSELFDNPTLNFEPNLKLATPVNYILGPGDELQINVYGIQEFNASITVSTEGSINVMYAGQIAVSGMSIEAATQKIRGALSNVYSTLKSGQSQLGVSLSRIRTIKITLIGAKQPGNYSISSLSSVYNALFLGGGPGKNGSYRNIELLRNNKVIKTIDLYHFLVDGNQSDNIGLKDNDVIRIPAYTKRVTLEGQVKRPGIFEMKKEETFSDLLAYASGFNEFAFTASVNVMQKTSKEFKVKDISLAQFSTYIPMAGDVYQVAKILNRFENRIIINGAVFRPDTYSFYEGMRISNLIAQADGLKEDAYTKRARIVRVKPNLTLEIVQVDLEKALTKDSNFDVALKKEDVITVYSTLDFVEEYKVSIEGEVKNGGDFDYYDKLTLNDLIIEAGGLTGSASKRVEIARMIKSEINDDSNPNRIQLFNLEIESDNNEQIKNFILEPFDVIDVRRVAVYEKPQTVMITGAINYSGRYVLFNKKEKILDIVKRAGGLTSLADLNGVKIKRPINFKQIENLENVNVNLSKKNLDENVSLPNKNLGEKEGVKLLDTIQTKLVVKLKKKLKYATIPVDWEKIVRNPNSNTNVTLFPGDEIEVAPYSESIKVLGNVLLTSEIPYSKGRSFNYYLSAVGGENGNGWRKKAYIIYPNGSASVTKTFLFTNIYPKVLPGSQIVVPEKPETKKMSVGEWVSIGSIMSSLALLMITAFR